MSFGELPQDVLLDILSHLDTARDFAHLSRSCKALHRLISHDGWRIFIRNCFSFLAVGGSATHDGHWDALAERLTRQSRCWERKEFYPLGWTDRREKGGNFFDGYGSASHPFSPAMDASLAFNDTYEFVAWGAGEDVVGRFRPLADSAGAGEKDAWFRLEGKNHGFKPVTGDVTAVRIVKPGGNLGMLVGRASGELQLVSAQGADAGRCTKSFVIPESTRGAVKSVSWSSVGYADVLPDQSSVLAGNRSTLGVFPLDPGADTTTVEALDSYSFTSSTLGGNSVTSFIHSVKSLGDKGNTIACALGADERPLNWLALTPTGLVPKTLDKNPVHLRPLSDGSKTTIRALETVGAGAGSSRGDNLLLSAWDDGTVRLFDTRTPSSCDVAFRDIFQPDETLSSLLSWGTNHFVAGSNQFPHLKVFDYRWSSGTASTYSYTKAAPCKDVYPFPEPPNDTAYAAADDQSYIVSGSGQSSPTKSRNGYSNSKFCNHGAGIRCIYHAACQTPYYRPNAVMILRGTSSTNSRARPARVISLAKSSDAADSFYVGLPSSVAEIRTTTPTSPSSSSRTGVRSNPTAASAAPAAAVKAAEKRDWAAAPATYSFLETGYGKINLEGGYPGLGISSYTPRLVQERQGPLFDKKEMVKLKRQGQEVPWQGRWHRWDGRFWQREHFS